nr:hypothetical protein [Tanacetum cinerariifolium]
RGTHPDRGAGPRRDAAWRPAAGTHLAGVRSHGRRQDRDRHPVPAGRCRGRGKGRGHVFRKAHGAPAQRRRHRPGAQEPGDRARYALAVADHRGIA